MNAIADRFFSAVQRFGGRPALRGGAVALDFDVLGRAVELHAAELRRRMPARSRVALCLSGGVDYVIAYFAVVASGSVPFLVDATLGARELDALIASTNPAFAITDRKTEAGFAGHLAEAGVWAIGEAGVHALKGEGAPRFPLADDTATCRFTSGSTSEPKCIEFSDRTVAAAAESWVAGTGLQAGTGILCLSALSNGLAFNTSLLAGMIAGATLHLIPGMLVVRFVCRYLQEASIRRLVGFPTFYRSVGSPGTELEFAL